MFLAAIYFHPSLIFLGKVGTYQSGSPIGVHSNGRLLALPANIRLRWKWIWEANSLLQYGNDYNRKILQSTNICEASMFYDSKLPKVLD